jgi:hypothetical protein
MPTSFWGKFGNLTFRGYGVITPSFVAVTLTFSTIIFTKLVSQDSEIIKLE